MFVLPMTIISICYTHIVCFVRAAVHRARKTNAMPIRKFNLIRDQGNNLISSMMLTLDFFQGAIHIKHRFSSTKDIKVFRHIIILITVLCIGKIDSLKIPLFCLFI